MQQYTIKDRKLDGLYNKWYKNGQKDKEGTYKDGGRIGKWTWWYKNGQKESEITFKDGKEISKKCWDEDGNEFECDQYGDCK